MMQNHWAPRMGIMHEWDFKGCCLSWDSESWPILQQQKMHTNHVTCSAIVEIFTMLHTNNIFTILSRNISQCIQKKYEFIGILSNYVFLHKTVRTKNEGRHQSRKIANR